MCNKIFFMLMAVSLYATPTTGDIRIATLLIKFQNDVDNTAYFYDPSTPLTEERCRSLLFESSESVAAFYHENSYGKLSITGDIFGPYVIPVDAPSKDDFYPCTCYEEALVIGDADIRYDEYDIILFIYPRTRDESGVFVDHCGFQGMGSQRTVHTNDGSFQKAIVWINGFADLHILAHEIGHTLGFAHANRLYCDDCYDYQRGCSSDHTMDPFDVMGYAGVPGYKGSAHFSAYRKYAAGWLTEENIFEVEPGTFDVTLTALESESSGIKYLSLPFGKSGSYCVEFRQNNGFDEPLSPLNGLLFRAMYASGKNQPTEIIEPVCGSDALVLRQGQVFRDQDAELQVEAIRQYDNRMDVRVVYSPINLRVDLADWQWPDSISLLDGLDIPFTLFNESPVDIIEPINLSTKITKGSRTFYDTLLVANTLDAGDSISASFWLRPQLGCGDYNVKMFVKTPAGFSEPFLGDNYLTDRIGGDSINVLCDGPELYGVLKTTPTIFQPGEQIDICCNVFNSGKSDSGPFSIILNIDGHEFPPHRFDNVAPDDTVSYTVQQSFECGSYKIVLLVDRENEVLENKSYNSIDVAHVWSDQPCDGYMVQLLWGNGGRFAVSDNTLCVGFNQQEFYFKSLLDGSEKIVHPMNGGKFYSDCYASDRYCVLREYFYSDSTILNIHDLKTGEAMTIATDQPMQFDPTVNNKWLVWQEGSRETRSYILLAQKLESGKQRIIEKGTRSNGGPQLTSTNLLYWRSNISRDIKVLDLESDSNPIDLPVLGYIRNSMFKDNKIVTFESTSDGPRIVWREYDPDTQTLSDITHQLSHKNITGETVLSDFNDDFLIFENKRTGYNYLYSIKTNKVWSISEILGRMTYATLHSDEIFAYFYDSPWEYFIGSVKIWDVIQSMVSVQEKNDDMHFTFSAAPNPFNTQTTIKYSLPHTSDVEIHIYNTMGQRIAHFDVGVQPSGLHKFVWNGGNEHNVPFASGVYFCVITVDGNYQTMKPLKMVLLK